MDSLQKIIFVWIFGGVIPESPDVTDIIQESCTRMFIFREGRSDYNYTEYAILNSKKILIRQIKRNKLALKRQGNTYTFYHHNGTVRAIKTYDGCGERIGETMIYYNTGRLKERYSYVGGIKHGDAIEYYPNGEVRKIEHYVEGKLDGKRYEYYDDGSLCRTIEFRKGFRIDRDPRPLGSVGYLWTVTLPPPSRTIIPQEDLAYINYNVTVTDSGGIDWSHSSRFVEELCEKWRAEI